MTVDPGICPNRLIQGEMGLRLVAWMHPLENNQRCPVGCALKCHPEQLKVRSLLPRLDDEAQCRRRQGSLGLPDFRPGVTGRDRCSVWFELFSRPE